MQTTKQAYLSFRLNDELFAVSAFKVLEVLEKQNITAIPRAPEYIRGVINFRGEVLPVIDTRRKFNMGGAEYTKFVIIVLDLQISGEAIQLGAMADGVKDVFEADDSEIKDVPSMGCSYNPKFLKGMINTAKGYIMLLDIDHVFSEDEIEMIAKQV
jgi:purine-binding chemotaxis protein CheW